MNVTTARIAALRKALLKVLVQSEGSLRLFPKPWETSQMMTEGPHYCEVD